VEYQRSEGDLTSLEAVMKLSILTPRRRRKIRTQSTASLTQSAALDQSEARNDPSKKLAD
jgi:hypothetical protein